MKNIYEPEFVNKLFNQMSKSYERMNYVTSFGFSIYWRKQFVNKLGKSDKKLAVIDILSGLGENWKFLKRNFPNADFFALDFSEEMIKQSEAKAETIFDKKMKVFCNDILQNKFESNSFDIISCAFGLKTFNELQLEIIASEVYRMLKSNGRFSFIEVSKPKNKLLLAFYQFYLSKIIPVLGKMFLGNPNDYKMLWVYTDKFNNCKKVSAIFEKENLIVQYHSYFFGCATGISGYKL